MGTPPNQDWFESNSPPATAPKISTGDWFAENSPAARERPGFFKRLAQSVGIPTTMQELKATLPSAVDLAGAAALPLKSTWGYLQDVTQAWREGMQEAREAGENIGEGGPVPANIGKAGAAAAHILTHAVPFVGAPIETAAEDIAAKNYPGAAGGLTGVIAQTALLSPEARGGVIKAAGGITKLAEATKNRLPTTASEHAAEGYGHLIQSLSGGRKADFPEHIERLAERGHMKEFADTYDPQTIRGALDSLREYMNDWENSTINPAAARHPDAALDGDSIARRVRAGVGNTSVQVLFPQAAKAVDAEATRFAGKKIPIQDVVGPEGVLAKLNALSKGVQNLSPESKAAAELASSAKASLDRAVDAVRDELYGTLDDLGEPGMREVQRDYGSMREFQEVLRKNVSRAELAEARKPGYSPTQIAMRGYGRHPLLAGTALMSMPAAAIWNQPLALGGLAVPPIAEIPRTILDRAALPDAQFRKAMSSFAKGPRRIPLLVEERQAKE